MAKLARIEARAGQRDAPSAARAPRPRTTIVQGGARISLTGEGGGGGAGAGAGTGAGARAGAAGTKRKRVSNEWRKAANGTPTFIDWQGQHLTGAPAFRASLAAKKKKKPKPKKA